MNVFKKNKKIYFLLLVVYLILLLNLILFKDFDNLWSSENIQKLGMDKIHLSWKKANLIPFKMVFYYLRGEEPLEPAVRNLAGNTILFIPLGFLIPFISNKFILYKNFIVAVLSITIFFELSQFFFTPGIFDIDDIILNLIGGSIGFLIYKKITLEK